MKLVRLDIDGRFINREYFYKIEGDLGFTSYDPDRKLARFLYDNYESAILGKPLNILILMYMILKN